MRKILLSIVLLGFLIPVKAQNIIKTFAGTGTSGSTGDNGLATSAQLQNPEVIAFYGGFLYISERGGGRVRRINLSTNVITTLLTGLTSPRGIAFDENGKFYLAETHKITRYDADGTNPLIVAGSAVVGETGFVNGKTPVSRVNSPRGIAYDEVNKILYIADLQNNAIRKLDCNPSNVATYYELSTFANTAGTATHVVNSASAALTTFRQPSTVTLDANKNVFWMAQLSYNIYKSNPAGTEVSNIINVANPSATNLNSGDEAVVSTANVRMGQGGGLAFDANGDLYFSDYTYHRVRKIAIGTGGDNKITAYVGNTSVGNTSVSVTGSSTGDGNNAIVANTTSTTATSNLNLPYGIAFGSFNGTSNILFIAESGGHKIRVVGPANVLPLTLTSFETAKGDNEVVLKWNTESEVNVREFSIEKRDNVSDFKTIQSIPAKNVSPAVYQFVDRNITSTENYYRLKMIDYDGTFKYSEIEFEKFPNLSNTKLMIYPNPINDLITLNHDEVKSDADITIYSASGQLIKSSKALKGTNQTRIEAVNFLPGHYVLVINENGVKKSLSFLK